MTEEPAIPNPDLLLRRVNLPDHVAPATRKVSPKLFKPRRGEEGEGISLTACREEIGKPESVDEYLERCSAATTFRLGCVFVRCSHCEAQALAVKSDPLEGEPYGHLHVLLTDPAQDNLCPSKDAQSHLALEATLLNQVRLPQSKTA